MHLQALTGLATLAVTAASQTLWSRDVDYKALSKELSASAKVYFPGTEDFEAASKRWSNLDKPTANIVVVPATENDVVEIVSSMSIVSQIISLLVVENILCFLCIPPHVSLLPTDSGPQSLS